jgi:DNA ligase-1
MDTIPGTQDPNEIINSLKGGAVELTENIFVEREDQLENIHDLFVDEGYEGLMLRNLDMPYEFSRSWNLVKYKVMKDDEFKIVDAEKALKGKQRGAIIWICETPQGDRFNVVPNGTIDSRKKLWTEWLTDPTDFIGKELTVQYQELTPKGIPRFPKGIAIRDYE